MVVNYLDGIYLDIIALNGDDGGVWIYTLKEPSAEYLELVDELEDIDNCIKDTNGELPGKEHIKSKTCVRFERNISNMYKRKNTIDELICSHRLNYAQETNNTKEQMPAMNYTIVSDEIKLNYFASKFLYSDEMKTD